MTMSINNHRWWGSLALVSVLALAGVACGDDEESGAATAPEGTDGAGSSDATTAGSADVTSGGDGEEATISIVGFAVPEAANKAIAEAWTKTPEGESVTFETSYGASGDQSRAVVDGLEADYVHFSVVE